MNITSYVANISPTHFRGPPPNGRYLKERITVLLICNLHNITHGLTQDNIVLNTRG